MAAKQSLEETVNGWRVTRGLKIMPAGLFIALAGFVISFWWYWAGYAAVIGGWVVSAIGWVLHGLERRRKRGRD